MMESSMNPVSFKINKVHSAIDFVHTKNKIVDACEILENNLPPFLRKTFHENAFVSGGCIPGLYHGMEFSDYDFFFINKEAGMKVVGYYLATVPKVTEEHFAYHGNGYVCTENAVTLYIDNKKYQLIYKNFGQPHIIVSGFDFFHDMSFYTIADDTLSLPSYSKTITLSYNYKCGTNPLRSIQRYCKFISRGYKDPHSITLYNIIKKLEPHVDDVIKKSIENILSSVDGYED